MRRIVYLCPESNLPVGGIKVIYRHVEALNRLGAPAYVLHPADPRFRCDWFSHDARFLDGATLNATRDFVVIPDVWSLDYGLRCLAAGVRYAVFVQNGYRLFPKDDAATAPLRSVIAQAELLLSISADTDQLVRLTVPEIDPARLMRVRYSIPPHFVGSVDAAAPGSPGGTITFMPRKLAVHARLVTHALRNHLPPCWRLQPVDGVGEAECAALLRASRLFLAFSELEGMALPPLEAAVAGNVVVGYTGRGGRENWLQPNFVPVEQGDVLGFVAAARAVAAQMDAGDFGSAVLRPGIDRLTETFSAAAEARLLAAMVARIASRP